MSQYLSDSSPSNGNLNPNSNPYLNPDQPVLVCICGPTASGKTALSIALAQWLHTEIISADSMQVYRGLDIGTAKPTLAERQGIPHHLLDVCETDEPFSVARYVQLADAAAQDILSRGKTPLLVGGTGLYMDSLIECNTFAEENCLSATADTTTMAAIRRKYQQMAVEQGNEAVHACLRRVDPERAQELHPNNLKRVIRALEVYEQTGMTLREWNQQHKRPAPKYRAIKIGLCPDSRQVLYERIDARVDQMLQNGLLEEVHALYQAGRLTGTAAQAIGYKEFINYWTQNASLEDCVALLKQRSRQYAKRQLTWLRRDPSLHWIVFHKKEELPVVFHEATEYLQKHGVQ